MHAEREQFPRTIVQHANEELDELSAKFGMRHNEIDDCQACSLDVGAAHGVGPRDSGFCSGLQLAKSRKWVYSSFRHITNRRPLAGTAPPTISLPQRATRFRFIAALGSLPASFQVPRTEHN